MMRSHNARGAFALGSGDRRSRSGMAGGAVVEVLDLDRREVELDPKLGLANTPTARRKGGRVWLSLRSQRIHSGEDRDAERTSP